MSARGAVADAALASRFAEHLLEDTWSKASTMVREALRPMTKPIEHPSMILGMYQYQV
jgi:hypothetical protein